MLSIGVGFFVSSRFLNNIQKSNTNKLCSKILVGEFLVLTTSPQTLWGVKGIKSYVQHLRKIYIALFWNTVCAKTRDGENQLFRITHKIIRWMKQFMITPWLHIRAYPTLPLYRQRTMDSTTSTILPLGAYFIPRRWLPKTRVFFWATLFLKRLRSEVLGMTPG